LAWLVPLIDSLHLHIPFFLILYYTYMSERVSFWEFPYGRFNALESGGFGRTCFKPTVFYSNVNVSNLHASGPLAQLALVENINLSPSSL